MYSGMREHVSDLVQHQQHLLVGAAVQRAGQSRGRGRRRQVWIGLRTAHRPHGVGAAVLLVVGMQDEQDRERPRQYRVGQILRLQHLPEHVHEVGGVTEVVVRINVGQPQAVPVGVRRNGRHLGDQPHDLVPPVFRVQYVPRLRIHRGERRHRADQHPHGVRVIPETFQELLRGLVDHGVMPHQADPVLQLGFTRQLAVQQKVSHLQKRALFRQFFDRIPAVPQDSAIAIDISNAAPAGCGIQKSRIIRHDSKIFRILLDLTEIHRADGAVGNRRFVGFSGALVRYGKNLLAHEAAS